MNQSKTDTMTPEEALLWLAGLETPCPETVGYDVGHHHVANPQDCPICHGTRKVPVLDLREPCPNYGHLFPTSPLNCSLCGGRNWVPKQGEMALHQAMHKAGWSVLVTWPIDGPREVLFAKGTGINFIRGENANDWLAAVKAMKAGQASEELSSLRSPSPFYAVEGGNEP